MTVIEEQQDKLTRKILDHSNAAVLLLDESLALKYVNPSAEMLFAVSAERLMGKPLQQFVLDDAFIEELRKSTASGNAFTQREVSLPLLEHTILVDLTVIPIIEDIREVIIELVPIERLQRITREESLLQQQQATRLLMRGVAHEVKNPLGGLRGAAQLLERELMQHKLSDLSEYTQIIIDEADRLKDLVDRMLGPNNVPKRELINVHMVTERVRSLMRAELSDDEDITVQFDYDPSLPDIYADASQLIQALLNIVRNAAQALREQRRSENNKDFKGVITLRTRIVRHFTIGQHYHRLVAKVEVIDNGPGIPETMMESIFYPMVTGRAEGTGLGLSISQAIVSQHGGLIECASQPGNTVFTLLLPFEQ